MRSTLATLAALAALAALAQGCMTGRYLYLADETPVVDELPATSSVGEGDAASTEPSTSADVSDAGGLIDSQPPAPPVLPATPPVPGAETCTAIATECVKGGPMQTCITTSAAGECTKLAYTHDGKTFACATGCTTDECLPPYYAAYISCQDAVGACSQLAICCEAAGPIRRLACRLAHDSYVMQAYGDVACKAALTGYRDRGICP